MHAADGGPRGGTRRAGRHGPGDATVLVARGDSDDEAVVGGDEGGGTGEGEPEEGIGEGDGDAR